MPYTDHEKKLDRMRDWRRERTKGYHRWLYARRMLSKDLAAIYEQALNEIAENPASMIDQERALAALDRGLLREREIGNRYDHEQDRPYFKED